MAKRNHDDTEDSPLKLAKPGDDTVESSVEFAKPVYLVAAHLADRPAYSVSMVDAAAVAGGNEPPTVRNLGRLRHAKDGMSFVAAHSKHGSWIVGVGGRVGRTIIISDPSTGETFDGPELCYPKYEPVLISHRGKVYAISHRPLVHPKLKLDFEPWFESLSFNKGVPCLDDEDCPYWKPLPPPPFFPCLLTPLEFRNPPNISVSSYAAVGSHILLSLEQEEMGTYAFHVGKKTWEKICDKKLPFVGHAMPLGGSLFAACCDISNNATVAASVFHMSIKVSSTPALSGELTTKLLSTQEFTVVSEGEIPRPLFCPLGKGSFCAISKGPSHQSQEANHLEDLQIILTAFQMDNIEAILTACQKENAEANNLRVAVQVRQHNHTYEFDGRSRFLASPMHVVAALSMDSEHELFQEKTETRARETTGSSVFEAPIIRMRT